MPKIEYFSNQCNELYLLESLGFPILESYIIKNVIEVDKNSDSFKIVFTDLSLLEVDLENPTRMTELSWADLVVCFTPEVVYLDWEEQNKITQFLFNNTNLIYIAGGIADKIYPKDKIFCPYLFFFMTVKKCNTPINYSQFLEKRVFLFDALLGVNRWFRKAILEKLEQHNLLDKSIAFLYDKTETITKFVEYETPGMNELEDPLILDWKQSALKDPTKKYAIILSSKKISDGFYADTSMIISHKIYQNSWFSIVSETMFQDFFFLTEKTAKCLFAKRIFIMFGSRGSLKFLREQGFKTFDGLIDESYDLEIDPLKRLNQAFKQVLFLSNCNPIEIYKKAEPTLEHNFNLLVNGDLNLKKMRSFISVNVQNTINKFILDKI